MDKDYKTEELILVFKTNLTLEKDVKHLSIRLNQEQRIISWNVDLTDIDRVLRIESTQLTAQAIIQIITAAGYSCEELRD